LTTNTSAEAFAPASMGNVGVGFDILGLAFQGLGDKVLVERRDEPGAIILSVEGSNDIPLEPAKNTASVAVNAFLNMIQARNGVAITITKGLPLASGLGSSAASAVAAVVATNALLGNPISRDALLAPCLEGESLVSGYHLDNVAPCLMGGITLVSSNTVDCVRHLPVPRGLFFALVTPNIRVPTARARAVLPQTISLATMITQTGAVARLVDAFHRGDVGAVAAAMEKDSVIEPARAHMMPHFLEIREMAKKTGALAVVISGAGPTLCAICDAVDIAHNVADVMHHVYHDSGVGCMTHVTEVDEQGARVLSLC
jgi:homoserine kinase